VVGRTIRNSKNLYKINLVGGGYPSQVPQLPSSYTSMFVIWIIKSNEFFTIWLVAYNGMNYLTS